MKNSALTGGSEGTKRTRNGIPKARGLLESQERKHNASNNSTFMDLIRKYNDFHIVKEGCVVEQIFDLQYIVGELEKHKIHLAQNFQVGMLIAKLPFSLRLFATSIWQHKNKMCMDDLVASIIEENERSENDKSSLQKMKNEETDIRACWTCRKVGCESDSCRRPKSAIQMVKKIILNTAAASAETDKNIKLKNEHSM